LTDLEPTCPKMPPPLRAVFLDLGNTLVTERSSRAEIYASSGRAHGLAVTAEEMALRMEEALAGLPEETVEGGYRYSDAWFLAFQRRIFVEGLGLSPVAFEVLSRDLFERFQQADTFRVLPGARELLAEVRAAGLAVGLISNWSERLGVLLRALELDRAFDVVLGSAEERLEKPEPALFHRAVERVGVRPQEALHAGNDLHCDVGGAQAAGLEAVLVCPCPPSLPDPPPCPVVGDLVELRALIRERLSGGERSR
jgi:putative hydrolase of the HAD superfamily